MNAEERLVKSDTASRYTLGVVYSPNTVDSQGDFTDAKEIEKACHAFTKHLQGKSDITKKAGELLEGIIKSLQDGEATVDVTDILDDIEKSGSGLGLMHSYWSGGIGDIVENYIAPQDMTIGKEAVTKGSWLMGVVWSPAYFEKIQDGTFTGYSMGGTGKKVKGVDI